MVVAKLDMKVLEGQSKLTEAQEEQIALEALQEAEEAEGKVKKEKEEEKLPEEVQKELDEQKKKEAEEEAALKKETGLTDEEKATQKKEEEETQKKEEERILAAKEEELSEEDKTKKVEIVKTQEEAKKKSVEQEIETYAKELGVSVEEARAELENISKLQEKYKGEPKQLAKALLHSERVYSKMASELKTLKDAKPAEQAPQEVSIEAVMKWMEDGKVTANGKQVTKEQILEAYREANPEITETLDDDKVFRLAAKETRDAINKNVSEVNAQLPAKAKEKRDTVLNSLSEADKKFLPEVKPLIEKLSDAQIMNENFNIETYITYAKGKLFDTTAQQFEKEKKEFGDKEYQRGLEEAKILGTRKGPDGKPPKSSKDIVLSEEQKIRAREMFDNPDISETKAFEMYKDYLKETGAKL